jgi:cell division protein FtsB
MRRNHFGQQWCVRRAPPQDPPERQIGYAGQRRRENGRPNDLSAKIQWSEHDFYAIIAPGMEKIKNFFGFLWRAWTGGIRGKVGVLCMMFALFAVVRLFIGDVTVQKFAVNMWKLAQAQEQLAAEKAVAADLALHIKLLQEYSPDYIEELAQKYLNMGSPKTRILKI